MSLQPHEAIAFRECDRTNQKGKNMQIQEMIDFLIQQGLITSYEKPNLLVFADGERIDWEGCDRALLKNYLEGMVKAVRLINEKI